MLSKLLFYQQCKFTLYSAGLINNINLSQLTSILFCEKLKAGIISLLICTPKYFQYSAGFIVFNIFFVMLYMCKNATRLTSYFICVMGGIQTVVRTQNTQWLSISGSNSTVVMELSIINVSSSVPGDCINDNLSRPYEGPLLCQLRPRRYSCGKIIEQFSVPGAISR